MSYDFNDADHQQNGFDLIPKGTIAPFILTIRPGGAGENGWLTESRSSDALMLNAEFTISDGPYAKRKIFQNIVLSGGKLDEKGNSIGGSIGRSMLRAILESARNIKPDDQSDMAMQGRRINGFEELNGLAFIGKVGIQKDKTGHYEDKNQIAAVITPDMKEYARPTAQAAPSESAWTQPAQGAQPPQQPSPQPARQNPRPAWAN